MSPEELENKLFEIVQDYSKPSPLIIWGSGATIPLHLPSMDDLKEHLKLSAEEGSLEDILSKKSEAEKDAFKLAMFELINRKDGEYRSDFEQKKKQKETQAIKRLICHFIDSHPRILNIITTNYDCVLEYIFSYNKLPFSDGFTGHEFSEFNENRFRKNFGSPLNRENQRFINLYKPHGSLRWYNERYSYHNSAMDAVLPARDKYAQTHQEPFRSIITESDAAIKRADCFLAIGFGFGDEHLTPKILTAINANKSIVVVTKEASDSCKEKLSRAKKYMLIEKGKGNTTSFTYKENHIQQNEQLTGSYWELDQFNTIIGAY